MLIFVFVMVDVTENGKNAMRKGNVGNIERHLTARRVNERTVGIVDDGRKQGADVPRRSLRDPYTTLEFPSHR